jgi:bifunctional UDP-N-acetylglucosamine pyrophosphorylase/glucosamine-1-phosphate N-acetyltransferase
MCVLGRHLKSWLPNLSNNNAQGEYYLTDVIAMACENNIAIQASQPKTEIEITGVNNRSQQAMLEREYQLSLATQLMDKGLSLLDPSRFDLRGTLAHGDDCEIDINCVFEGDISIGSNVKIGPNCLIKNTVIEDGVSVHANSIIEDAHVGAKCNIGPFARLRPGTRLQESARIGNFVETKKANIGVGSKVNHLSYVGDAEVGENVNIGAGTITCNYDGVNKSQTKIGDNSFVGSNTALVAPVSLSESTTVAAGSVVTSDSEQGQLVVGRSKQRNINGWKRPTKKN